MRSRTNLRHERRGNGVAVMVHFAAPRPAPQSARLTLSIQRETIEDNFALPRSRKKRPE
jgi:hypothetical protein